MRSGAEVPRRGNTYGLQPRAEAPLLLQTNGSKDPPGPSEPPGSSFISEIKHEPARRSQPHSSCWEPRQKQARVGLVFAGWLCESGAQHGPPLPLVSFVAPAACREHVCGWLSATDLLLGVLALFWPSQPEERNCRVPGRLSPALSAGKAARLRPWDLQRASCSSAFGFPSLGQAAFSSSVP